MLAVAIDAGGTRCRVNLATKEDGVIASASLGPCNYTTLGLKSAVDQLRKCFEAAKAQLPNPTLPVSALVLGMAGLDRESDVRAITPHLADMFSLDPSDKSKFIVGNDATLLSLPMLDDRNAGGIAVVAGTGSVVFAFTKNPQTGIPVAEQRAEGYGALLGDPGSGFHIGQLAIVSTLAAFDAQTPFTRLHEDVLDHFDCQEDPQLLLARVYDKDSTVFPDVTPTGRIASTCKVVMRRRAMGDSEAEEIVRMAVSSLTDLVAKLSASKDSPQTLVLGGGLFSEDSYRTEFLTELKQQGDHFARVVVVDDTGKTAAHVMARRLEQ